MKLNYPDTYIRYINCLESDVGNVVAFLYENKLKFHTRKTIHRMICGGEGNRKPYRVLVAVEGSEIVGIAITSFKSRTLSLLFVAPSFRKCGVGKELCLRSEPLQILSTIAAIPYFAKVLR